MTSSPKILKKLESLEQAVAGIRQKLDTTGGTMFNRPQFPDPLFSYNAAVDKGAQVLLSLIYQQRAREGLQTAFRDTGFRVFSQNDEDGIILYLMSSIGMESRKFVELGCGNGVENNTANLVINHGWHGLQADGAEKNIETARFFYGNCRDSFLFPPLLKCAWIEPDDVDRLIAESGFESEIDLLSIDLDGVDYWTWKSISCIQPRLVIVETPTIWGPDEARTIPYEAGFHPGSKGRHPDFYGASLLAYVKLGKEKGYRLVACSRYGTNAFFLRRGVAEELIPEIAPEECFRHPRARSGVVNRLPRVKDYPWVKV